MTALSAVRALRGFSFENVPLQTLIVTCNACGALVIRSWRHERVDPDPWKLHQAWHNRAAR